MKIKGGNSLEECSTMTRELHEACTAVVLPKLKLRQTMRLQCTFVTALYLKQDLVAATGAGTTCDTYQLDALGIGYAVDRQTLLQLNA